MLLVLSRRSIMMEPLLLQPQLTLLETIVLLLFLVIIIWSLSYLQHINLLSSMSDDMVPITLLILTHLPYLLRQDVKVLVMEVLITVLMHERLHRLIVVVIV